MSRSRKFSGALLCCWTLVDVACSSAAHCGWSYDARDYSREAKLLGTSGPNSPILGSRESARLRLVSV